MEVNYGGYPVFKGLQLPLEFMGIRGRFIWIAAATFGAAFLGFILFYVLFGTLPALIVTVAVAGSGLAAIYVKQKKGLHSKKRHQGIFIYSHLFER